ncbi:putative quinol monooxygenase [Salinisphaera aquimarina]|uniref:Quinol monooxygenase n=1 Tax=Salinisphaera aquimarina TaxID=2094031 RepID=A0ABV7ELS1_9GAMM
MISKALWVPLQAKPGKEADVEAFLESGLELVQNEPGTKTWYAVKLGPASYGIFDTFDNESGRDAHLAGEVAKALMNQAPDLFAEQPQINKVDVLAAK